MSSHVVIYLPAHLNVTGSSLKLLCEWRIRVASTHRNITDSMNKPVPQEVTQIGEISQLRTKTHAMLIAAGVTCRNIIPPYRYRLLWIRCLLLEPLKYSNSKHNNRRNAVRRYRYTASPTRKLKRHRSPCTSNLHAKSRGQVKGRDEYVRTTTARDPVPEEGAPGKLPQRKRLRFDLLISSVAWSFRFPATHGGYSFPHSIFNIPPFTSHLKPSFPGGQQDGSTPTDGRPFDMLYRRSTGIRQWVSESSVGSRVCSLVL